MRDKQKVKPKLTEAKQIKDSDKPIDANQIDDEINNMEKYQKHFEGAVNTMKIQIMNNERKGPPVYQVNLEF